MQAPRLGGIAGAGVAVALCAAVLSAPAPLAREPRPPPGPHHCAGEACEPGPTGLVARLDDQLAARIPGLDAPERRVLARTIVLEAERARLDPLLVLALIEVESAFDPLALSLAGARGLMQLREPTLRREAQRSGLELGDLHDPVVNVQAGVRYLRRLFDAFGREEVALMAYNAGPNRILGYLREGEIPERFFAYPRRVSAELRRLRRSMGLERPPAVASRATPTLAE